MLYPAELWVLFHIKTFLTDLVKPSVSIYLLLISSPAPF